MTQSNDQSLDNMNMDIENSESKQDSYEPSPDYSSNNFNGKSRRSKSVALINVRSNRKIPQRSRRALSFDSKGMQMNNNRYYNNGMMRIMDIWQ